MATRTPPPTSNARFSSLMSRSPPRGCRRSCRAIPAVTNASRGRTMSQVIMRPPSLTDLYVPGVELTAFGDEDAREDFVVLEAKRLDARDEGVEGERQGAADDGGRGRHTVP